ncbi:MAG: NUDIX domain-containing protein [Tildeniella nuda ZEHNDER 1965/U140]|jgi:ADP-ribose pyrophosphatase YjhB (NUDIX family)|nr:NUDIX domain-containing protein [Tildeniella nuda ZEHNDER 1965/U140]
MHDVPHFQEAGRINPVSPDDRLPEAIYSKALDFLVLACVDLVFTHRNQILLAKRNTEPRSSWWIVGGRMVAGEEPKATARRKAQQEAQLDDLDASRFQYLGVYSTCFAVRHQAPQQHGSHSLNITYQIELTSEEKERLKLRSDEYDTWQWVESNNVAVLINAHNDIDRALLSILNDWQSIGNIKE